MIYKIKNVDDSGKRIAGTWMIVPNHPVMDDSLSLQAIGLWCRIAVRNPDHDFTIKDLTTQKSGYDAVKSALVELEEANYVRRSMGRKKGRFGTDYMLYEKPYSAEPIATTDTEPKPDANTTEKAAEPPIEPPIEPKVAMQQHEVASEKLIEHFERNPEEKEFAQKLIAFDLPAPYFAKIVSRYLEYNCDNRLIMSNPVKNYTQHWANFGKREIQFMKREIEPTEKKPTMPARAPSSSPPKKGGYDGEALKVYRESLKKQQNTA